MPAEVEHRHVSAEELQAGVSLTAGHRTVLILGGGGQAASGGAQAEDTGDDAGGQAGDAGGQAGDASGQAGGANGDSYGAGADDAKAAGDVAAVEPGKLEVQVLTAAGQPAKGVLCSVKAPDGTVQTLRTDDEGMLRIGSLPNAGECELDFPELRPPS